MNDSLNISDMWHYVDYSHYIYHWIIIILHIVVRFSLLFPPLPQRSYRLRGLMVFWCGQYHAHRLEVCRVKRSSESECRRYSETWVTLSVLVSLSLSPPYCCVLTDFDFSISVTWWRRVGLRAGFHNDGIDIYWGTWEEWWSFPALVLQGRIRGVVQVPCHTRLQFLFAVLEGWESYNISAF